MMQPLRRSLPERAWDRAAATHLLRRAGFCPSEGEIVSAIEAGLEVTVDRLIDGVQESERARDLNELGERLSARDDIGLLRGWWLSRMRYTNNPLHARLSSLWHGHFATSNEKVNSATMMLGQLRAIETHAMGSFHDLTLAMSRDPAMIVWLDNNLNVKGRPNENFARELFELFTLGVGNYSEPDIKEAARAFTGWTQKRGRFRFVAHDHDEGQKQVLGASGDLSGEQVVRIAVERPACAAFIASKLLAEFVTMSPSSELVGAFAAELAANELYIGRSLRTLFLSEAFYAPEQRRARIKSPVELVIGMGRSLELDVPANVLATSTSDMGQRLFEPPTVAGWEPGRAWLNSATMLVRLNASQRASELFDGKALASRYRVRSADDARRLAIGLTLDAAPASLRTEVDGLDGSAGEVLDRAVRLALSAPEYQFA